MVKKSKIYGIELKEGEEVVRIVRHHWIDFIRSVLNSIIIWFIAFFIIFQYLKSEITKISIKNIFIELFSPGNVFVLIFWVLVIAAFIYFLSSLYVFKRNVLIITNFRVIDNKVKNIFSKVVSDVYYEDIFDVLCVIRGFWPTILRYGNIIIKTPRKKLVFKKVKEPQKIKELITISNYQ